MYVVPHVRREVAAPAPTRLARMRRFLGIRDEDTVLLCINAWDPRKRMSDLVAQFAAHYRADDRVILVVKTGRSSIFDDPASPAGDRDVTRTIKAILDRVRTAQGREPGRVACIADDTVGDAVIDTLHHLSHAQVSFSRCEGFGLSLFDAASIGRPVFAVGYGGPLDYLGTDWPSRIPHRMVPSRAIPGFGWFDAQQQWPDPDDDAAMQLIDAFVRRPAATAAMQTAARQQASTIAQEFDASVVAPRLLGAVLPDTPAPRPPPLAEVARTVGAA